MKLQEPVTSKPIYCYKIADSRESAIYNPLAIMRALFIFMLLVLTISSCSKRNGTNLDLTLIDSTGNTLYIDSGRSSIVINNSGDSTRCYDVKSVEYNIVQIAPEGEWMNYVSKQSTATITCDGQEGQKRIIKVELRPVDQPDHVAYTLLHNCDEIHLEHDYYQIVTYGCCDAEPIHRIYDYTRELILEGNARILTGAIPNNPLKFFVGYTPDTSIYRPLSNDPLLQDTSAQDTSIQNTSVLGTLKLAFDANKKYEIKIMSPPLPPDLCSQYSPVITLIQTYSRDSLEVFQDEYQLWELENIQSIEEIRNVAIHVQYLCEIYYPVKPIIIPITKGRPFGKDSLVQTVHLIHITE